MSKSLYLWTGCVALIVGCSTQTEDDAAALAKESNIEKTAPETSIEDPIDTVQLQEVSIPRVLIVPCSNGYTYISRGYDLNPSLEKQLQQDERIEVVPFPYVTMKGAGYFGVYDKKECDQLLAKTDVDFLIMTRFIGGDAIMIPPKEGQEIPSPTWGFSTKVLQTQGMNQFNGISAKELPEFEDIDASITANMPSMVKQILDAHSRDIQ